MALPTQKRTKSSKRRRASHFALSKSKLVKCPKCGKEKLPHHVCQFCGSYKGKQIIRLKAKKKTTKQKAQDRKEKAKETKSNKKENK